MTCLAGINEVVGFGRPPFAKHSIRAAWRSGTSAFMEGLVSGFRDGVALYRAMLAAPWRCLKSEMARARLRRRPPEP